MLIMYEYFNENKTLTFDTRDELVNYLAQYNYKLGTEVRNPVLNKIGNNPNDVARVIGPDGLADYINRTARVYHEGRSIFDSNFKREVLNHTFNSNMLNTWYKNRRKNWKNWFSRHTLPDSAYPEFRKGPWPHIYSRYGRRVYRYIRTTNEIRQSADPEYKDFIRKSRGKNLPDTWQDEPLRDWRNSGWKKQGHNKHQWEVNIKTQTKHKCRNVYVSKHSSIKGLCDLEHKD